jgi:integrase
MAGVKSPRVRDVLEVLWETGTRPVNLARATKEHIASDGYALVFDEHNTPEGAVVHKTFKRTGEAAIVPLTDRAREIVLRLAEENPTGPLFRTPRGLPWTASRLGNTVRNYAKKVGLEGKFIAYSARHTLATVLLQAGRTSSEVASVLGNTPKVVERNYSHIAAQAKTLREVLCSRRAGESFQAATGI